MKKSIYILALVAAFTACNTTTENNSTAEAPAKVAYQQLAGMNWLIGKWENNSPDGYSTEIWEQKNDSVYSGTSYFVIPSGDTVSSETISLQQNAENVYYIPTVKNQNDGQPVKFTLTSATDTMLVFENPEHDFPNKITYTRINQDSVVAQISGTMDGKANSMLFPFKKVK